MQVKVFSLGGSQWEVDGQEDMRVGDVKGLLESLAGVIAREQRLLAGAAELADDQAVAALLAKSQGHLTLLRRDAEQARWLELAKGEHFPTDALLTAPAHIRDDYEVVMAAVSSRGHSLRVASEELQADRNIVLAVVARTGEALEYASADLRGSSSCVVRSSTSSGTSVGATTQALHWSCAALSSLRLPVAAPVSEVVLRAVQQSGLALMHAAEPLAADRALVLAAVGRTGGALQHASPAMRADPEVVLAAALKDSSALRFADEALLSDLDLMSTVVKRHGSALKYASNELRSSRALALTALRQDSSAFKYVMPELRADRQFVLQAVQANNFKIECSRHALRTDTEPHRSPIGVQ